MADKIIFKNTDQEANLESIQTTDVLNGEMLLVRETDKESLYCKNTNNEISKIHRITDAGGFPSSTTSSYEAVDLGLPSGLLWANKNIGAETEEDAGLYFQWGDIQGYTAEQVGVDKEFYSNFRDYKFGTNNNFIKYTSSDGLTILEPVDDAATQIMGSDWRIPTRADFQELISNTDIYFISTDGSEIQATLNDEYFSFPIQDTMNGVKFYRKNDHSKYIFFPSSGNAVSGSIKNNKLAGSLHSSQLYTQGGAYNIIFTFGAPNGGGRISSGERYLGLTIRAVKPQQ